MVDFTFVSTWAGTAYTAFVIDAFARLITGWRTAASHSTDLVLDALVMKVTYRARQGVKVAGLTHHSDAGSEYLSIRYGAELVAAGIAPSVGSVGDSYDNALAESIIGLYKAEVIDHLGPWETPAQVEAATSEWASWYNTARVMRRTGGRPRNDTSRPGGTGRSAGSPPAGRAAGPTRHQKEAAMAAAHYPGGLRPHPPGLRPGPRPSSEMAWQVRTGAAAGGHLLAHRGTGATEPPLRSRAPPASQAMTLRVTLALPGEPAAQSGCPTRRCPSSPPGGGLAAEPATRRGSWTAQLDRCSTKQKRKMIRPWFRQAAVPWKTTATQTRASGENRVSTKPGVLQWGSSPAPRIAARPLRSRRGLEMLCRCRDKRPVLMSRTALASVWVRR